MSTRVGFLVSLMWLAGLCGCTITQTAQPVLLSGEENNGQICVIENPRVFQGFLPAYRSALESRGFSVTVLKPASPVTSCALTSTYTALRSWDFVTYMSHAVIAVYRDGATAGGARYDAPKAGFALTFRIYESTESKVATMVAQLFPTRAGE